MNKKIQAALWIIASVCICPINDGLSKFLFNRIPADEVLFFRYLFACLTMLPLLIVPKYKQDFKTKRIGLHIVRGGLFCIALLLWLKGLKTTMLASSVLFGFASPIFFIIMAYLFLKENVSLKSWICTIVSFLSLFFIIDFKQLTWDSGTVMLLASAFFFGVSDIINKKYASNESTIAMSFYSNLFAFLFLIFSASQHFVMPNLNEMMILILIGLVSNGIIICVLKAYSLAEGHFLNPFKFLEFISAMIIGFVLFREVPPASHYITLAIILGCNIYCLASEEK